MSWQVTVNGDAADLDMLAARLSGDEISVTKLDHEYVLDAGIFAELDSAEYVRERAKTILTSLSGLTRLVLGSHTPLTAGAVYRVKEDGSKEIHMCLEPATIRWRAMPVTITSSRADGTKEVHHPADPVAKWLPLATTDECIAKALRLRNAEDLGWVDLYRIYEVIEGDIGRPEIVTREWATDDDIKRFKHTANSVTAAGDQARHGKKTGLPPKKPASLSEARELVDRILKGWLEYKAETTAC